MAGERELLQHSLGPGKDCPPIERLELCLSADTASAELKQHVDGCTYCRTELEMLRQFEAGPRDAAEAAAARAISDRLAARLPGVYGMPARVPESDPWWKRVFQVRWLAPAALAMAGVLIAIAVGIQMRHRNAPGLDIETTGQDVYRSGAVSVIAPVGDLREMPAEIQWQPVNGAVSYDVRVMEVDQTELWKSTAMGTHIDLPKSVQSRIVPAKTLLLQVTARDSAGRKLAESETVRFRLLQKLYTR